MHDGGRKYNPDRPREFGMSKATATVLIFRD
jgi:hypothetical protein